MDGFRERLGGRYDRSGMRGSGYERMPSDERFENDRYERAPRRGTPEITTEMIGEAVNEAVTKANQEQLDVIADFFDEAKADRMESERAIIDALSHSMNEAVAAAPAAPVREAEPAPVQPVAPIVVDEQNTETLARIERIAGQNAEAINESNEMIVRSVDSLRSNSEILNELKSSVGQILSSTQDAKSATEELRSSVQQSLADIGNRTPAAAPMQDLTVDFTQEKNEIIGAVGDNRAILNMIRQDVLNGFAKNESSEEEEAAKPAPLSAEDAANYYSQLEDHVHKECVKCYRNVQQALTEQNAEANSGVEKSIAGLRIMVLLAMLFGFIDFVILLLQFLISMGYLSL